jgi:serine/threonine protein kinase
MEDFGGTSLNEWVGKVKQQSLQEFLEIAIALSNTLDIIDILYRERIIHKDIKPSNILINPVTKQIKLIDFSIASLLPRETQTLVNPNILEGTLAYISPEQTGRMNRGIDYYTDFYSLGVTFYELLAGKLPFVVNEPLVTS